MSSCYILLSNIFQSKVFENQSSPISFISRLNTDSECVTVISATSYYQLNRLKLDKDKTKDGKTR